VALPTVVYPQGTGPAPRPHFVSLDRQLVDSASAAGTGSGTLNSGGAAQDIAIVQLLVAGARMEGKLDTQTAVTAGRLDLLAERIANLQQERGELRGVIEAARDEAHQDAGIIRRRIAFWGTTLLVVLSAAAAAIVLRMTDLPRLAASSARAPSVTAPKVQAEATAAPDSAVPQSAGLEQQAPPQR
jgi:hypothetical protein